MLAFMPLLSSVGWSKAGSAGAAQKRRKPAGADGELTDAVRRTVPVPPVTASQATDVASSVKSSGAWAATGTATISGTMSAAKMVNRVFMARSPRWYED